jgi:hypothetical protein
VANGRDHFGTGNKFITPTIASGKVYVGTTNGVGVFGLLTPKAPIVFETESLPAATSGPLNQVLKWVGFTDGRHAVFATTTGAYITCTVNVPTAGMYDVKVAAKTSSARGEWQLSINGSHVGHHRMNTISKRYGESSLSVSPQSHHLAPVGFEYRCREEQPQHLLPYRV